MVRSGKRFTRKTSMQDLNIQEVESLQAMLHSLGYKVTDPAGQLADTTTLAIKLFQHKIMNVKPTGDADTATRKAIKAAYRKILYGGRKGVFPLTGRVADRRSKTAITNVTVKVFNREVSPSDGYLGEATTDENGWFTLTIKLPRVLKARLRLYSSLVRDGKEQKSTKTIVVQNYRKKFEAIVINMDLPGALFSTPRLRRTISQFQKQLVKAGRLRKYADGMLDDNTVRAYERYRSRHRVDYSKPGDTKLVLNLIRKSSQTPLRGLLVRIGPVDSSYLKIAEQAQITDSEGRIRVDITVKKRLPRGHKEPVKLSLWNPANQRKLQWFRRPLTFDSTMHRMESSSTWTLESESCINIAGAPEQDVTQLFIDGVSFEALPTAANNNEQVPLKIFHDPDFSEPGDNALWINFLKYASSSDVAAKITFLDSAFENGPTAVVVTAVGKAGDVTFKAYDKDGNLLDTQVHTDGLTAKDYRLSGGNIHTVEVVGAILGILKLCYEGSASTWSPSIADQAAGVVVGEPCECDPCVSAFSPSAYYVDLLGFAGDTFKVNTAWLENRLTQPLSTVVLDCEAVEARKSYLGFVNAVLVRFIAERRNLSWRELTEGDIDSIYTEFSGLPTNVLDLFDWVMDHRGWTLVTSERLDNIYEEFSSYVLEARLTPDVLLQAFSDILRELGTNEEVVAAAVTDTEKQALVDTLGLDITDFTYLSKGQHEVVFSDLERGFELIQKSRRRLLFQSYRNNIKQENYQLKLQELLALIEENAPGAPADAATAESEASVFAEAEAVIAEPELTSRAGADAQEQATESREHIESSYLAAIRTNLLYIAHNEARRNHYGLPTITTSSLLGDYLSIDVSADTCKKITYIGFLIEVLQSLLASFKAGHEDFAPLTAKLDLKRWIWMRSYGLWHAIQSIFLYPSNFVFPSVRRIDTGWAGQGWSHFFEVMTEYLDEQARPNLRSAQEALDLLADQIRHLEGTEVSHMVETKDHLYLFCCNVDAKGDVLYYSRVNRDLEWTGWQRIDLLGQSLRKSNINGRCIQDVVVLEDRVYVFFLVREDFQAMYAVLDQYGVVAPPVPLTDKYIDNVKAVVLRPRLVPRNEVPAGRILAFYPNPEVISSTSPGSYTFQQYLIASVSEDGVEELSDAGLEVPAGATIVSVASLSGLSNHNAADILKNIHMGWSPGVTVYSPVLFAIKTGNKLGIYAHEHADDRLWDSFQTNPSIVNLPYDPAWRNLALVEDAPGVDAMKAKLLPRWIASPAASIGTSFECWFFNGAYKIYKLDANMVQFASPIHIYSAVQKQSIDTISLYGNRLFIHNDGYFIERDAGGNLNKVGQVVLGGPDFVYPLEINLVKRSGSVGSGTEPVETENGRRQLKTVQARKFSHITTEGYARDYLAELFLHAPLYIANLLNEEERFEDARSVLSVVFQPFVSIQEHEEDRDYVQSIIDFYWPGEVAVAPETQSHRFIYYGFFQEDFVDPQLAYRGTPEFLEAPVNPHSLADHRPLTYARAVVRDAIENLLDWADWEFSMDAPESVPRARELYEDVDEILRFDDLPKDLCAMGYPLLTLPAPAGASSVDITRGFCIPPDPIFASFRFRVDSNLEKIRTCRNIAGVKRALPSYAAAVDPTALVEAVAAGAELDSFVPSQPPPLYRYSVLFSRAKELTQTAIRYEAHFVSIIEKYDSAVYTLDKARNDVRLANEEVSLRSLHVTRANQSVRRAELQLERVQVSFDHYDQLLTDGHSALESAAIGMMITTAAGQATAAGVAAYYQQYVAAAQFGVASLQSVTAVIQTYAAFERREQEWRYQLELSSKDLDIADQGISIANTELDITAKERSIAELRSQFARDTVEFLTLKQFANAELYGWMKKELRKLYRKQLNMALASGRAAQEALAFELQEPLNFIGYQYGDVRREDILGAEKLGLDLDELEQHRFTQAERRREITTEISLAAAMPGEFARFRSTGVLEFATPAQLFDRHYPGHYQRLIKSVEISVVALIPPTSGIHATLSNHGISRVMTGAPFAEPTIIQRPPESISLSSPVDASGLFALQLNDPMLLPFEGCGVDSSWTFEMPLATNPFNFETIMDVRMRIRYTARHDAGFRDKVISILREEYSNTIAASARTNYPDSWYDFHNPRFGSGVPPYTIVMRLLSDQFPPNEREIKIERVIVAVAMDPNIEIPVNVRFEPDGGGPHVVANGQKLTDGRVTLNHFLNKAPFGNWVIEFDTAANPNLYGEFFGTIPPTQIDGNTVIETSRYGDVLLIIEYCAELRF